MSACCLQEPDWRARESAILALGAISIGCATGLVPFLPQLVNLLMPNLQDSRPLVRWGCFTLLPVLDHEDACRSCRSLHPLLQSPQNRLVYCVDIAAKIWMQRSRKDMVHGML